MAEKSGSLVAVERVESDWIQVLSACRAKLLGIPTKSAHQIVNLVEIYEVEKFLKQAIHEALEELAAYEIAVEDISADDSEPDESASSAAESDSEPSWYLLADPNRFDTIEVGYLDGVAAPFLDQQDGWNIDGVEYKVRIDAAATPLEFRTMYKNGG